MSGNNCLPNPGPVDEGPIAAAQIPYIEHAPIVANHRVLLGQNL